jgi:hypothetical protein
MSCPKTKVAVTPFFNNYRPQFYFRTTDVTGAIELPEGKEMPGDNVSITVKLINPIAMEELALRHPKAATPLVLALWPKSSRNSTNTGRNYHGQNQFASPQAFD